MATRPPPFALSCAVWLQFQIPPTDRRGSFIPYNRYLAHHQNKVRKGRARANLILWQTISVLMRRKAARNCRDHGRATCPKALAAILAADVVGYSRLMAADEEGTLAKVKVLQHEIWDPRIQDHRGRVVKRMGDGILLEFGSAVDAVRCAIKMQEEMAKHNEGVSADQRIEIRIGIHVGDVIVEDEDIFGDVSTLLLARRHCTTRKRFHFRRCFSASSGKGVGNVCRSRRAPPEEYSAASTRLSLGI